jgi:DNA ligase (NAD+)
MTESLNEHLNLESRGYKNSVTLYNGLKDCMLEATMNHDDYLALVKQLNYHDDLYYNQDRQEITDGDYDKLYAHAVAYETEHPADISPDSPTQTAHGQASNSLAKVTHVHPMLSLDKAQTIDEVRPFLDKFKDGETREDLLNQLTSSEFITDSWMVEHKEDGLTIVLYYNFFEGQPFVAATRGGSDVGEDVTYAMSQILPKLDIDGPLVVRGEAIFDTAAFDRLVASSADSDNKLTSPRNAIAGAVRTKNSRIGQLGARFLAYNIENASDRELYTETDQLNLLDSLGFETSTHVSLPDKAAVIDYLENFSETDRQAIDHEIDGLVIKPNFFGNRDVLGATHHHPLNQIAFKFPSEDAITILRDVNWQIGKTGQITPVANFDPIDLAGANIEKATLANIGNIRRRDIRLGDHIVVRRSNDVIPQVVTSIPEMRDGSETEIKLPDMPSHFEGDILISDVETDEMRLARWANFVSKQGLNIDALSAKTIETLASFETSAGHLIDLNNYASLFNWEARYGEQLSALIDEIPGFGAKRLEKILGETRDIHVDMAHFAASLGMRGLGPNLGELLQLLYPTFEALVKNEPAMDVDHWLDTTDGVGPAAREVLDKLREPWWQKQLDDLLETGAITIDPMAETPSDSPYAGKTFVITGKTVTPRAELTDKLKALGAKVAGSVSKNTDFLIIADPASTSSKAVKARELGVTLLADTDLEF